MLTQSEIDAALEVWEENIPKEFQKVLDDIAMEHTYPVRGIIRNLLSKVVVAERQRAKVLLETLDEIQRRAHTGYIAELARKTLNTYNKNKPNDNRE